MQEARFAGACQDQHTGRPAPSLRWPGERKSISATILIGKPGAWAPGPGPPGRQGLGARGLGPVFRRSEKSPETSRPRSADLGIMEKKLETALSCACCTYSEGCLKLGLSC